MSIEWITLAFFGGMLLILIAGLPIAFGLGGVSMVLAFWLWGPEALTMSVLGAIGVAKFTLLVSIPMFVFMGMMMSYAGIADDLYTTLQNWLAPIPGALASATIGVSTIFAAIVGSEETATLAMGKIALPLMRKRGYNKSIAIGSIQAGAALGFLIPPSILAIIYAVIAQQSVGRLFAGGLFPGLVLSILFVTYITVRCKIQPHLGPSIPKADRVPWQEKVKSLRSLILPGSIILLVIGSIFAGLATPVEASAVGALGSIVAAAVKRRLTWNVFSESLTVSIKLTALTFWIFMAALTFGKVYDALGAKELIEMAITGLTVGPWGTLLLIQLSFFVMGTMLDGAVILFITMPIYIPIIQALGFDPLWFGVLYLINMEMATLTPPFGYALFLMKGVCPPDISMGDIYRSVTPFVMIQGLGLILTMVFPQIALWLPNVIFGRG